MLQFHVGPDRTRLLGRAGKPGPTGGGRGAIAVGGQPLGDFILSAEVGTPGGEGDLVALRFEHNDVPLGDVQTPQDVGGEQKIDQGHAVDFPLARHPKREDHVPKAERSPDKHAQGDPLHLGVVVVAERFFHGQDGNRDGDGQQVKDGSQKPDICVDGALEVHGEGVGRGKAGHPRW